MITPCGCDHFSCFPDVKLRVLVLILGVETGISDPSRRVDRNEQSLVQNLSLLSLAPLAVSVFLELYFPFPPIVPEYLTHVSHNCAYESRLRFRQLSSPFY